MLLVTSRQQSFDVYLGQSVIILNSATTKSTTAQKENLINEGLT